MFDPSPKEINNASEIDLRALLLDIWQVRYFVLVVTLCGALMLGGLAALSRVAIPTQTYFQSAVTFSFLNKNKVEGGNKLYPNGTLFSISDLISPIVLERVYKENELDKLGFDMSDFSEAISVFPYAPKAEEVSHRYQQRLSNKKLSFVEREKIEAEMREELDQMIGKSAIIRLSVQDRLGFSQKMGEKIVDDIVKIWSQYSVDDLGVLVSPGFVKGSEFLDQKIVEKLNIFWAFYLLENSTSELKDDIKKSFLTSGISTAIEKQSGYTLDDLQRRVELFDQYANQELANQIVSADVIQEYATILMALRGHLDALKSERDVLLDRADMLGKSLEAYLSKGKPMLDERVLGAEGLNQMPQSSTVSQLDEGFLDRIIQLGSYQEDQKYRQSIVNKQIELRQNASTYTPKIRRLEWWIKFVETQANKQDGPDKTVQKDTLDALKANIVAQVDELNGYWDILARLHKTVSQAGISSGELLYVKLPIGSSMRFSQYHPILNARVATWMFALVIALAISSLFFALGRRLLNK